MRTTTATTATTTGAGLQSRDALPARLLNYAALHDAITRDLDRLERLTAWLAATGGPAGTDLLTLSRWWERFERCIVHHHEREDDLVFPLLAERGMPVDPVLTEDHHELDRLMATVRHLLVGSHGNDRRVADPAGLAESARALREHMDDHLVREEAVVFPAHEAVLSEEDVVKMERQMRRGLSLGDLAFTAPWILDGAHPRVAAQVWADAPAPLRVLYRLFWQRSYATVAAPILAVAR